MGSLSSSWTTMKSWLWIRTQLVLKQAAKPSFWVTQVCTFRYRGKHTHTQNENPLFLGDPHEMRSLSLPLTSPMSLPSPLILSWKGLPLNHMALLIWLQSTNLNCGSLTQAGRVLFFFNLKKKNLSHTGKCKNINVELNKLSQKEHVCNHQSGLKRKHCQHSEVPLYPTQTNTLSLIPKVKATILI